MICDLTNSSTGKILAALAFSGELRVIFPAKERQNMISWIGKFISWVLSTWTSMPESTKDKVIEAIVESFTEIFRNFFRSTKNTAEEEK